MPYNNTAIPPPEEITGAASLPLARVKKILHIDEDIIACSNNGAFAITIATEMFIRYLAEQAMNMVKTEKKPRRNIQYKDMANAVARIDSLQFLEDVIPRTSTFREFKAKKASKVTKGNKPLQNGQTTLDAPRSLPQRPIATNEPNGGARDDGNLSDSTISEADQQEPRRKAPAAPNTNGGLVFEHYEPNGTHRRHESGDVEMS